MQIINLTDAKAKFSEVISQTEMGEEFIVTKMGKPVARISHADKDIKPSILGLMTGQSQIPDDFNQWPAEEAGFLEISDDNQ